MSRPPARAHPTGSDDRVLVSNARGQSRIVGDPFAPSSSLADPRGDGSGPPTQLNTYGHSVNIRGETSGALLSRQQQAEMKSQEAAGMLLDALQKYGPAPGARAMLDWERDAATHAIEAGVYVTWRSRKGTDCTRVGPASLCFCGHAYAGHGGPANAGWKKNKMSCDDAACPCANFNFIPRRPEECGEWWLPRRKEFDVRTYRAKCKCGHAHTDHDPKSSLHRCRACTGCSAWVSAFLCVVCDCHSEDHETVWETAAERVAQGKPTGEDYMPFAEAPQIRKLVFDRKAGETQARPGENPAGGPAARKRVTDTAAGTAAAAGAPPRKAIAARAGAGVGSSAASSSAAVASSSVAAHSAPARAAAAAASASSSAAPRATARPAAASSAARPLESAFAAQSLDDDGAGDGYEDSFDQPARPPPQRAPPARPVSVGRASPATAASVAPRAAPRAAPRPAAAAPVAAPTRSAAAAAPSRSAASSSRQQRLDLESQLASQARQSSSAFKPVFD